MGPQLSVPLAPSSLFSPSLISSSVQAQLPEGYRMRPLEATDYRKGFYDCLAGLTLVGNVSEKSFLQTFENMRRCESVYHIVVIEELCNQRIVATGTLIVEQKFLRGCAKAGHIEDIVVHDSQRGKKFGIRLIEQLKHIGALVGCYKLLLTCAESNEVFYEKSGFKRKDLHLAQYIEPSSLPSASESVSVQPQPPSVLQTQISQSSIVQLPQQTVQPLLLQQPLTCAQQAMGVVRPVNKTSKISTSSFSSSSVSSAMPSTSLASSASSTSSTASSSASSTASPPPPSSPSTIRTRQPLTINVNMKRNANSHGVPLEPLSASIFVN